MKRRINNRDVDYYVNNLLEFTTNNETMYGTDRGDLYVVYSYGEHFPMYVWDRVARQWYGNRARYLSTTSRHQSYARPPRIDEWMDHDDLLDIVYAGGKVKRVTKALLAA